MTLRYTTISFLTDYGHDDEFVGIVKSVIRGLAPEVAVVDVTHNISPYDVRAGGLALARSAAYLVPGVVLAVVDPGVGTTRRAVAIEVGDGESVLVGPDNGLLAPAVALCGGATAAVELTNADYHLPAPGPTFAGRDVFAPVAAHLCRGVPLAELGTPIDLHTLLPGVMGVSHVEGDTLHAEVLWVDRYGNVQLNVDPDDVAHMGRRIRVDWEGGSRRAVRADAYDDLGTGEIGLVVDSYGLLSLAASRSSAALELRLGAGDTVRLQAIDDDDDGAGPAPVPVQLGRTPRTRAEEAR